MATGYPDIPITSTAENSFKTENYVRALSNFIRSCDTPMTIAIQGDWGTGKTSMMNMIAEQLGKDVWGISFNTWQYSQFNFGEQLPILMLNRMAQELSGDKSPTKDLLKKFGKVIAVMTVSRVSGAQLSGNEFDLDAVDSLVKLKEEFQQSINNRARDTECGRVVIFVDDLDRLQPQRAVEVLEIIKLFLDCKNCVFVLAVDYSVVSQGVRAKYGETMTEEKGRSFFDKIIQLPFKMPVAQYNIDRYLRDLMLDIWGNEEAEEDSANYLRIIDNTIGKNPRSIKRTVNSFAIINQVAELEGAMRKGEGPVFRCKQKVLFALLCMQLSCEPLYMFLMENADRFADSAGEFLDGLEDDERFAESLKRIYHRDVDSSSPLFTKLNYVIDIFVEWARALIEVTPGRSSDELVKVLSLSSITSSDTAASAPAVKTASCTKEDFLANVQAAEVGWYYEIAERLAAGGGYNVQQYYGQHPRVKLIDGDGRTVCDAFPRKAAGLSVDFYLKSSEEQKQLMGFLDQAKAGNPEAFRKYTPFGKSYLAVRGIRDRGFFEGIVEYLKL